MRNGAINSVSFSRRLRLRRRIVFLRIPEQNLTPILGAGDERPAPKSDRIARMAAFAALVAAGASMWQAYITRESNELTRQQVELGKRQLDESIEAGRKQAELSAAYAEAMRESASASKKNAETTERQSRFSEAMAKDANRGNLEFGAGSYSYEKKTRQVFLDVNVRNAGQTSATIQSAVFRMEIYKALDDRRHTLYYSENKAHELSFGARTLAGGGARFTTLQFSVPPAIEDWLMSGRARFVLRGDLDYEDIFGRRWRQTWCLTHVLDNPESSRLINCRDDIMPQRREQPLQQDRPRRVVH